MLVIALVLAGIAIGVPLGVYGHWSGWGFGLGWWGKPTPARVLEVTPLTGAVMKGGADWAVLEQAHRVQLRLVMGSVRWCPSDPIRHRPWPNGPVRADFPVLAADSGAIAPESDASSSAGHNG